MMVFIKHKMRYLRSFTLFCIVVFLASCVDLSGSRYANSHYIPTSKNEKYDGEVHTMRGGLGIFSIGMNQLQAKIAKKYNVPAYSTMWYNAGNVTRSIVNYYYQHDKKRPIILIGHSLGGNEQIKVARNLDKLGIPVDLLVTVDAVSQNRIPANVKWAVNVYKPGYVPMFSGLRIVAVDPKKTHIENINSNFINGIKVNHFTIDKDKVLQALILERVEKVLSHGSYKKAEKRS
jgi:hypothetical protein